MKKESGIHRLFELEKSLPVQDIKVNGIAFWPVLRIYFGSGLAYNKDARVTASQAFSISKLTSIFYGFGNMFKTWNFLGLSSSDQRKEIDGKWVDKIDYLNKIMAPGVIMELPNPEHKKRSSLANQRVMSKMILYAKSFILEKFIPIKIEGDLLIEKIENELGIEVNERAIAKRFIAQIKLAKWILRWKKPGALFLTTPYTNFGYVYAFRKKGKPVYEFQHGTINSGHYAYQINDRIDENLYPEYLLTTGNLEKEALKDSTYVIQDKIIAVGSFYIDHISSKVIFSDEVKELRKKYEKIVCVSAQDRLEEKFIPFLKELASREEKIGFWLLPRFRTTEYYDQFDLPQNVFFLGGLTTHEAICLSDLHSTINSTTAIESLALGTRNILFNTDNLAKSFFSEVLKDGDLTYFADTVEDYQNILRSLPSMSREEVQRRQNGLIKLHFEENLTEILKRMEHA